MLQRLFESRATLRAERDHYKALSEQLADPQVKEFTFGAEGFDMKLTGKAVEKIAIVFVSHFKAVGAVNYLEFNLYDRDDPWQRYTLTVQKVGALSPADRVRAAEQAAEHLGDTVRQAGQLLADGSITDAQAALSLHTRPLDPQKLDGRIGEIGWDDIREVAGTVDLSVFDLLIVVNEILQRRAMRMAERKPRFLHWLRRVQRADVT